MSGASCRLSRLESLKGGSCLHPYQASCIRATSVEKSDLSYLRRLQGIYLQPISASTCCQTGQFPVRCKQSFAISSFG